jgi:hypothetical protein
MARSSRVIVGLFFYCKLGLQQAGIYCYWRIGIIDSWVCQKDLYCVYLYVLGCCVCLWFFSVIVDCHLLRRVWTFFRKM